ncbi:MAG TPA: TonB-dependent receptor [Candidatus Binataceae bacterium]|nr:TonB-dependent receptor [Candidatus Binataceae bacterium]
MRKYAILVGMILLLGANPAPAGAQATHSHEISGNVTDALGRPLATVAIELQDGGGKVAARTHSDAKGEFHFKDLAAGVYAIVARQAGYKPSTRIVSVGAAPGPAVTLAMESEQALSVQVVATRISRPSNSVSVTGNSQYTLTRQQISNLPEGQNTPINDVLQQMPGVVRDEDQQVHIEGEHADLQWRINGVMLPLDSFSGFGQILNSFFVQRLSLIDGVLPANLGYRDAGVLDIQTPDGCSKGGGNVSFYGGQRETVQPSFDYGGCDGGLSYFMTGTYLHDNLGFSQSTPNHTPLHDLSDQGQFFGYFSYALSSTAKLSLITGVSINNSEFPNVPGQTPLYSLAGVNPANYPSSMLNESLDQDYYFAVLSLSGVMPSGIGYQVSYTARYSTITFNPDDVGDLIYQGVASDTFHSDFANTLQTDLTYNLGSHLFGAGFYVGEYGVELDDTSRTFPANSSGQQTSDVPISIVDNQNAINMLYGVYLQDVWQIAPKLTLTAGIRWDMVTGLTSGNQFSPRINLLYKLNRATDLHAGFARFFQTPSFETISPRSFALFQNTTAAVGQGSSAILPERDYYWDAGVVRHIGEHLTLEENAYFRLSHDLIDLGQFGYVPIFVPFNYRNGRIYGAETSATYNWKKLAVWANFAYSIAQGNDVVTGQYNFTPQELSYIANHYIYLDHEQYYTASGGITYGWRQYLFSLSGVYGSGLRAGFANTQELPENYQIDVSAMRSWQVPGLGEVQGRVVLVNLMDRINELRNGTGIGIFEPAYGPRRTLYAGITVPLPALGGHSSP